jgi:pyridoxamine 5'-phosphate oxidase
VLEDLIIRLAAAESLPDPLPADPMPTLSRWFDEAKAAKQTPNPDAIALATTTSDGRPSARMVLCRGIEPRGCALFYTNYESRKAGELESNPRASIVFHFDHHGRQVRAEGRIERAAAHESDAYFNRRPLLSRLGSWASKQSTPLESRADLVRAVASAARRMNIGLDALAGDGSLVTVPRPPHWGGYRLWIERLELWCGGSGRLHDRAAWTRTLTPITSESPRDPNSGGAGFTPSPWTAGRIYP